MHVCLLSNGPSAVHYPGPSRFDLVIGVNWTVTRWHCDWWVFCDAATYENHRPLGNPRIATRNPAARQIQERVTGKPHADFTAKLGAGLVVILEDMTSPKKSPEVAEWWCYSGCAGLVLAFWLKATRVTCYGVDLAGKEDFTGKESTSRSDERWARERIIWDWFAGAVAECGVEVERCGHA